MGLDGETQRKRCCDRSQNNNTTERGQRATRQSLRKRPPETSCGSRLAADEWQATTEIHRAFCSVFCTPQSTRDRLLWQRGSVEAVEAEDEQDSIREDFQELVILRRDGGCHPNPTLCHHVPDRPQRAGGWGLDPWLWRQTRQNRLPTDFSASLPFLSWLWRRPGGPTASRNTIPAGPRKTQKRMRAGFDQLSMPGRWRTVRED